MIASHSSIVSFGSSSDAVSEEWIVKAETALNRILPVSYKRFLREYAGGEIGGEEIYSIYGMSFDSVNGGDIVFHHLVNRKNGMLDDSKLEISTDDIDGTFFFDYKEFQNGECPIYLWLPSGSVRYADNFYEFLCKRIVAHFS